MAGIAGCQRRLADRDSIAVRGGRIASVATDLDPGEAEVLDAAGKLVVPGLLDVHAHYARDDAGPQPSRALCA